MGSTLASGSSLKSGASLQNGSYKFTMQDNCIAAVVNTGTGFVMSCTDNVPNPSHSGVQCTMEPNGLLKIVLSGTTLCVSNFTASSSSSGAFLKLDTSGVLHIVQQGGSSPADDLWTSSPVSGESVPVGWLVPSGSLVLQAKKVQALLATYIQDGDPIELKRAISEFASLQKLAAPIVADLPDPYGFSEVENGSRVLSRTGTDDLG